MPLNYLSKLLFPRKAPWRRNQQTKTMLAVILVAVLFAVVVTAFMVYANTKR